MWYTSLLELLEYIKAPRCCRSNKPKNKKKRVTRTMKKARSNKKQIVCGLTILPTSMTSRRDSYYVLVKSTLQCHYNMMHHQMVLLMLSKNNQDIHNMGSLNCWILHAVYYFFGFYNLRLGPLDQFCRTQVS